MLLCVHAPHAPLRRFGKGTLTADGIGLLCACISNLAERPEPPKAFITTHFSEVLDPDLVPRAPALSFWTMNVMATMHAAPPAGAAGAAGSVPPRPDRSGDVVFLYR